jgi:hypothetical protein
MNTTIDGVESAMTDFQFRAIIKMVLAILTETRDIGKVEEALRDIIGEKKESKESTSSE